MKSILLALSLFLLSTVTYAEADFLGTYRCTGYDPYLNEKYSGTVIVKQQNTVYQLNMNYDTGEHSIGTGGQYDPTLISVVFQDVKNIKNTGLEQYHFSDDKKTMQGYWVYLGNDKLGNEICERVSDVTPEKSKKQD